MDFEEFMVANSVSNTTLDMLKEKFETCSPCGLAGLQRRCTGYPSYGKQE